VRYHNSIQHCSSSLVPTESTTAIWLRALLRSSLIGRYTNWHIHSYSFLTLDPVPILYSHHLLSGLTLIVVEKHCNIYCIDPVDYCGVTAIAAGGGGAAYGMASPRGATVGGPEYQRVHCGTTPAVTQATSVGLPDFPIFDNLTFTQACSNSNNVALL